MKTLPKQLTRFTRARAIDDRYTQSPEWSGRKLKSVVARFCGDWIGQANTHEGAIIICRDHRAAFLRTLRNS